MTRNFKIYQKIILIVLLFVLPLLYLLIVNLSNKIAVINSAKEKKEGIQFVLKLNEFSKLLAKRRGLLNIVLNGDTSVTGKLNSIESTISSLTSKISGYSEKYNNEYEVGDTWREIVSEWQFLKERSGQMKPKESFSGHTKLIQKALLYSLSIIDKFGILLQDNLESYYMADISIKTLPVISEELGKARGLAAGLASKKEASIQDKIELTTYVTSFNKEFDNLLRSIKVLYNIKKSYKLELGQLLESSLSQKDEFHASINKNIINASLININPDALFQEGTKTIQMLNKLVDVFIPTLRINTEKDLNKATNSFLIVLTFVISSIGIAFGFCFYTVRNINSSVEEGVRVVKELSDGNLNVDITIKNNDEIGFMLGEIKNLIEKLGSVIKQITISANSLDSISEEVDTAAQSLSESSVEQAASLEETSASIEEITSVIAQNTENARETSLKAKHTSVNSIKCGEALEKTLKSIHRITEKIVNVGEISNQTNILAINATIEASRGGKESKGFAIVATEVKKLAKRCQELSVEINKMSEECISTAEDTSKILKETLPEIQKISDLIQEITAASEEQYQGIQQINTASGQMEQTTQHISASSEELAATSSQMKSETKLTKKAVSYFKIS